jgi:alkylated DNA repair dioxygenase AlkB
MATSSGFMVPPGLYITRGYFLVDHDHRMCAERPCGTCLTRAIDSEGWCHQINRRTQHYGVGRYDYSSKSLVADAKPMNTLPAINFYAQHLTPIFRNYAQNSKAVINQCIVNEYTRGQKISPHIDCPRSFGPVIASISVGGSMEMVFEHDHHPAFSTVINSGDVMLMVGPARYEWKHRLVPSSDPNFRRLSCTFRMA